jgi:hypothetical protein
MNTHKALGLLAAILITAGQALVFAADTSAANGSYDSRDSYGTVEAVATATQNGANATTSQLAG